MARKEQTPGWQVGEGRALMETARRIVEHQGVKIGEQYRVGSQGNSGWGSNTAEMGRFWCVGLGILRNNGLGSKINPGNEGVLRTSFLRKKNSGQEKRMVWKEVLAYQNGTTSVFENGPKPERIARGKSANRPTGKEGAGEGGFPRKMKQSSAP